MTRVALVFCVMIIKMLAQPCSAAETYDPVNGFPPGIDAGSPAQGEDFDPAGKAPATAREAAIEGSAGASAGSESGEDLDNVAQKIEGFNLVGYNDGGTKAWDIEGDKADIVGEKVAVTNVNANTYGNDDMNLKAKRGTINKATGDVQLEQDVVITSDKGATMTTDTLQWQRDTDKVSTKDAVSFQDGSMKVTGTGLVAHPSMKDARLTSDVTADIAAAGGVGKNQNRIQITSDGPMEVDQLSKRAIFRENVLAVELISGRRMKADMMEVHFDANNKKISEIVCMGNVELHQGANVTYSDMLVYKADEQRVVISGKPKLLIDPGNVDTQKAFQF